MRPSGFLVIGVSGSGKTRVGKALAERLGWDFIDADDFHPPENIAKMAAGIPLEDSDRAPWLAGLHHQLLITLEAGGHPVLACSALKEKYRLQLLDGIEGILLVYLKGTYQLIRMRMLRRPGHYMKPDMLQNQLDVLEEPSHALVVDIKKPVEEIVSQIIRETHMNSQVTP